MADTVIADMPIVADKGRAKKGKTRKALKQKNASSNEANILAGTISQPSPTPVAPLVEDSAGKENHESLSQPRSAKKTRAALKSKQQSKESFEKELQEMQEKLQQLSLEKEKTEELLKARDETLKLKEEELETRGQEQERLQMELKKLQKLKEFKPTMTFPIVQSLRDKEKKKKGCPEKKRPSPPYVLWCKDQWNEVKKANPDADFKDISSILGAKWKTVSAEEKQPYEEKYQAQKEAYLKIVGNEKRENEAMKLLEEEQKQRTAMELLEQYLQFKQESEKENKKTKKEKDPLKPKHPMSAFFLFMNERRAALLAENKNVLEVAKLTGEEWKNMSEKQRRPYEEMAKKNKEKYIQELELYKQKKEEEAVDLKTEEEELMKIQKQEALQMLRKKEKTENIIKKTKENHQKKKKEKEEKSADPNKPKKPASSFFLFSKEARKNLLEGRPGINNSTLNALISVKWKELSEEDKQMWKEKASEAMETYKKELEEYNKSAAMVANQ
uniref:Putative high mobility group B protein 6 n=1 Tax=Davidia involucrata TaxID=16924 RepID=A0A5B7CGP3_DAVIN